MKTPRDARQLTQDYTRRDPYVECAGVYSRHIGRETHTTRPREYAVPRLGEGWRQGRLGDGWTGPWEGWNTKKSNELLHTLRPRTARKKKKAAQVCNTVNKKLSVCKDVTDCAAYDPSGACESTFKKCETCKNGNYLGNNVCSGICVGGALILLIL